MKAPLFGSRYVTYFRFSLNYVHFPMPSKKVYTYTIVYSSNYKLKKIMKINTIKEILIHSVIKVSKNKYTGNGRTMF